MLAGFCSGQKAGLRVAQPSPPPAPGAEIVKGNL